MTRLLLICAALWQCGCTTVADRNGHTVFSTVRGIKGLDIAVWDGTKIHADEILQLSEQQLTGLAAIFALFAR